ncbi:MAG: single-stranded-DNA-specific exonuclease RecJ [Lachnospiraceae bacterium]|nr:single-stranded-DNA-specific exonuclease RecJ [Lachnospiraceae bacterium]
MKQWMVYNKKGDFNRLAEQFGIDPLTARCMVNRGIPEEEMGAFLSPSRGRLHDGALLKGAKEAAALLKKAIDEGKKIRVIGDYDVDGVFSTYILKTALVRCGGIVDYDIPHRITDGYGLNARLCEKAIADGTELVITCDNGIKAFREIAMLKEAGMQVIVTDHHAFDFENDGEEKRYLLPEADAVVNPHQPGDTYPFADICGAVVAWKLIGVLYELMGIPGAEYDAFLPFAAFATVCDIMPLVGENRVIVALGLSQLSHTDNIGLNALLDGCGRSEAQLNAMDIGFILGPCFNACGRLDSAIRAVELLEESSAAKAIERARGMIDLNERRKSMTEAASDKAMEAVEAAGEPDAVLIVYIPELHESLAGIVAGRLREKYYRPVFVLCDGEHMVKGSGRSIPGYPMADKLHEVEDILDHYGGHPMAAGLSLKKEKVEELRMRLNANAHLTEKDLTDTVMIDAAAPLSYMTEERISELSRLEPFGEGNEQPLFADKDLIPYQMSYIGRSERKFLKFLFRMADGSDVEALWFGNADEMTEYLERKFGEKEVAALLGAKKSAVRLTFTYYPRINEFRGRKTIQARIEDYR